MASYCCLASWCAFLFLLLLNVSNPELSLCIRIYEIVCRSHLSPFEWKETFFLLPGWSFFMSYSVMPYSVNAFSFQGTDKRHQNAFRLCRRGNVGDPWTSSEQTSWLQQSSCDSALYGLVCLESCIWGLRQVIWKEFWYPYCMAMTLVNMKNKLQGQPEWEGYLFVWGKEVRALCSLPGGVFVPFFFP